MTKYLATFLLLASPALACEIGGCPVPAGTQDARTTAIIKCFQNYEGAARNHCLANLPR